MSVPLCLSVETTPMNQLEPSFFVVMALASCPDSNRMRFVFALPRQRLQAGPLRAGELAASVEVLTHTAAAYFASLPTTLSHTRLPRLSVRRSSAARSQSPWPGPVAVARLRHYTPCALLDRAMSKRLRSPAERPNEMGRVSSM